MKNLVLKPIGASIYSPKKERRVEEEESEGRETVSRSEPTFPSKAKRLEPQLWPWRASDHRLVSGWILEDITKATGKSTLGWEILGLFCPAH